MVAAVREQAGALMHVSNLFFTAPMVALAERLAARSLGGRVFFANSGAEANEAALKLVAQGARRAATSSSLHGGFHGRTYGALSATPQESKQAPFAPLVPGFRAVDADRAAIAAAVDEGTAAVLLEPIQGERGVHRAARGGAARRARGVRRASGAALDLRRGADGMGRTGTLWAYEQTRRRARRDDGGQGAGRRAADRRAGHRRAPGRRASRPATTARRSPAARSSPRPRIAAFDVLDDPELLARVRELGERLREGAARAAAACSTSAAAGSWSPPTSTPTRPAWRAARCSSSGS